MAEFRNFISNVLKSTDVNSSHISEITTSKNMSLLKTSVTHSSIEPEDNYELLEYLGDGFVNLSIAFYLRNTYPEITDEGWLTKLEQLVKSEKYLPIMTDKLGLTPHIRWKTNVVPKNEVYKIKEDAFESFNGALYTILKEQYSRNVASKVVYSIISQILSSMNIPVEEKQVDPITRLKEIYDKFTYNGEEYSWKNAFKTSIIEKTYTKPNVLASNESVAYLERYKRLNNLSDATIEMWQALYRKGTNEFIEDNPRKNVIAGKQRADPSTYYKPIYKLVAAGTSSSTVIIFSYNKGDFSPEQHNKHVLVKLQEDIPIKELKAKAANLAIQRLAESGIVRAETKDKFRALENYTPKITGKLKGFVKSFLARSNLKENIIMKLMADRGFLEKCAYSFVHPTFAKNPNYYPNSFLGDRFVDYFLIFYLHNRFPKIVNKGYTTKLKHYVKHEMLSDIIFDSGVDNFLQFTQNPESIDPNEDLAKAKRGAFKGLLGVIFTYLYNRYSFGISVSVCYAILRSYFDNLEIPVDPEVIVDDVTKLKELYVSMGWTFSETKTPKGMTQPNVHIIPIKNEEDRTVEYVIEYYAYPYGDKTESNENSFVNSKGKIVPLVSIRGPNIQRKELKQKLSKKALKKLKTEFKIWRPVTLDPYKKI